MNHPDRHHRLFACFCGIGVAVLLVLAGCSAVPAVEVTVAETAPTIAASPAEPEPEPETQPVPVPVQACAAVELGDAGLGEASVFDLDGDGDEDAVAPMALVPTGPNSILRLEVFERLDDCAWRSTGTSLFEGNGRATDHNLVAHEWFCTTSRSGIALTQVTTRTEPTTESQQFTNFSFVDGRFISHAPNATSGVDVAGSLYDHGLGGCPGMTLSQPVDGCGGVRWVVDLPDGWHTPLIGDWNCSVFSPEMEGVPCQCDRVYPIRISWLPEAAANELPASDLVEETTISGFLAQVHEQSAHSELAGRVTRIRTWTIHLSDGAIVLVANDGEVPETPTSWSDLTAQLDAMARSLQPVA